MNSSERRRLTSEGAIILPVPKVEPPPPPANEVADALKELNASISKLTPSNVTVENNIDIERLINQQNILINSVAETLAKVASVKSDPTNDNTKVTDISYDFRYSDERDQRSGQYRLIGADSHVTWGEV